MAQEPEATEDRGRSSVDRRKFLQSVGAGGAAAALAGCTGPTGGSDTTTLEWASIYNAEETREAMNQALHDAGLSDDIEMNVTQLPTGNQSIQSRYDQWISSGQETPDLLTVDNGWAIPFIVRGQLVNLEQEELLSNDQISRIKNDYFQASVNTITSESGDLYGVPLYPEPPTIQYRKDLVEDAGYDTSDWQTNPMTWERFSRIAADVRDQSDVDYGYITQGAADENMSCCAFPEYFHSFGGAYFGGLDNLFSDAGDRPITVTEEPVVDSLRMIRTLVHGPDAPNTLDGDYHQCAPQQTLSWAVVPTQEEFAAGNGVFTRQWMFGIPPAAENFGAENLGVMPMPFAVEEGETQYDGIGGSSPALGGWHVVKNPNSPRDGAVSEFFDAMMQDSFYTEQFAVEGVMPPDKQLFESEEVANVEPTGRYVDAIGYSLERAVPRPVTPIWPQESQRISQQARTGHIRENDPAAAMSELEGLLQDLESNA